MISFTKEARLQGIGTGVLVNGMTGVFVRLQGVAVGGLRVELIKSGVAEGTGLFPAKGPSNSVACATIVSKASRVSTTDTVLITAVCCSASLNAGVDAGAYPHAASNPKTAQLIITCFK